MIGDAENHDSSSEASNGNDEVLENENENEIDDDFDDEDADDKDVEEEEEAEADSPAAFLSPAPRAVKVTAAAKKDQDQKAIANANAKGQGKYSIPVDSMLLQSPFKKTWSRGNWTMEEDELLRAGGRLSLLSLPVCLSMYVSIIYLSMYLSIYVCGLAAVHQHGGKCWKKISSLIADRTDVQCLHRWQKVLRPGLIKGPWTLEVRHPDTTPSPDSLSPCYPLPCIKDASGMSSSRYIHTYMHAYLTLT
jgi:hypothetical protein